MNRLPDILKDCTNEISSESRPVYPAFGNWNELLIELKEKKESPTYSSLRYPLIFLHNDYKEAIDEQDRISSAKNVKVYIIVESYISGTNAQNPERYTTQQRWDNIYKLVIEPIYDDFILRMKFGARFIKEMNRIPHERKDLFKLWVGDEKNRLPDNLDAIELTFSELKYYLKNC